MGETSWVIVYLDSFNNAKRNNISVFSIKFIDLQKNYSHQLEWFRNILINLLDNVACRVNWKNFLETLNESELERLDDGIVETIRNAEKIMENLKES